MKIIIAYILQCLMGDQQVFKTFDLSFDFGRSGSRMLCIPKANFVAHMGGPGIRKLELESFR